MSEPDDDSIDINLRPATEVGERMVLLAALIRMALVESEDDDEIDPVDAAAELNDLEDALQIGPWSGGLSPEERRFVRRDVAGSSEADILAMMWRIEALVPLAWATYQVDRLPHPWIPADPRAVIAAVPAPWEEVEAYLNHLGLRGDDEVAEEREIAELWAWRCAIEEDFADATSQERSELARAIRETAAEAHRAGLIQAFSGDFGVDGRTFKTADPETKALIAEVSLQRLHALNWLCGYGPTWDDVPLDL